MKGRFFILLMSLSLGIGLLAHADDDDDNPTYIIPSIACHAAISKFKVTPEQAQEQRDWLSKCVPEMNFDSNDQSYVLVVPLYNQTMPMMAPTDIRASCDPLVQWRYTTCDIDPSQLPPAPPAETTK